MSKVVELDGGIRGAVGLEWGSVVLSLWKAKKKELKANASDALTFFQVQSSDGETLINFGTCPKEDLADLRREKGGALALAGLLALSNPEASIGVLERIDGDQDQFWFCLSQNGQVVTGSDLVGDLSEIEEHIEVFRDLIEDSSFKIIGNAANLFEAARAPDPAKEWMNVSSRAGATIDAGKDGIGVIGLVLIIGAFISVCAATYFIWFGSSSTGSANQLSPSEVAEMQRQQAAVQLKEEVERIDQLADMEGTLNIITNFLIKFAPKNVGGWSMTKAVCAGGSCTLEFQNENWTQVEALARSTRDVCDLAVTPSGESAVCTASYELVTLKDVEQEKGVWLMERSQLNTLRGRLMEVAKYGEDAQFGISEPDRANIPGIDLLPAGNAISEGNFNYKVQLKHLDETAHRIGRGMPLAMHEARFNISDATVDVSASYFIQSE